MSLPEIEAPERVPARAAEAGARHWVIVDAVAVVVLLVGAYVTRRHGLPVDGLWHDDAWPAAGAVHGSLRDLLLVGSGHPGFSGGLMVVGWLTGDASEAFGFPSLVAGVLGPAALFLALRWLGYERSIGLLLAGLLVVADIPVLYSGRVKPYTIDALVVLGLAVLLPRLARRTWRWPTAVGWIVTAMLLSSLSGFALVAAALGAVILVLHPASDLRVRVVAAAVQATLTLALVLELRSRSDLATIEEHQETLYDGHIDFSVNPFTFAGEVLDRLRWIGAAFPGGPAWLAGAAVGVAVMGLAVAALGERASVHARYLGLLLLAAFAGALLGQFPFGPRGGGLVSRGERASMWLVPVVAIGIAAALQRLYERVNGEVARVAFHAVVGGVAVVVIALGIGDDAPDYPFPGMRSATAFLETEMGPRDVALLPTPSLYAYAVETSGPVTLRATPELIVPYVPRFGDDRVHNLSASIDAIPARVRDSVSGADRVFVPIAISYLAAQQLDSIDAALRAEGFEPTRSEAFDMASVVVWERR